MTVTSSSDTSPHPDLHGLVAAAREADGVVPLNELGRLALHGERPGPQWIAREGDQVTGWAWLDPADSSVQLVVHPDHRRKGIGRSLADAVITEAHPRHWWAFGTLPGAEALAASLGLRLERQLLIMVRDLHDHPAETPAPLPGIEVVGWTPELTADLVRVNAAAFAHHPEQGAMTADDVARKASEPGFDPAGLLLARDLGTGEVFGFHWTQIEPDAPTAGEVYVLGVHPDASSRGVGRHLLAAGLAHLQQRGAEHVHLYVEADQTRVVKLYDSASFVVRARDSSYA